MFNPFKKGNKSKVVVKTAKGGGMIRKLKAQISVGTVLLVMGHLGLQDYIPEELYRPVAEFATELIGLVLILVGYYTTPGEDDGVTTEEA